MVQSQFSLLWDSYKTNICSGFASLQQNGELVDMTLAADGHFVKVHQVLIALSSPYLKQLILSVPSQHPVIFLNNISHATLSQILEYIYTGQVIVPSDNLSAFIEAAKSLHIKGLETVIEGKDAKLQLGVKDSNSIIPFSSKRESCVSQKILLPANARKIQLKSDHHPDSHIIDKNRWSETNADDIQNYEMEMDDHVNEADDHLNTTNTQLIDKQSSSKATTSNIQFTVSIRGSLQVILNRYIYNVHSSQSSGIRRWRCIDYRNKKCSAFVVTKGNVVLNRANPHNHSFHDKKILDKIEKNAVYSALDEVKDFIEKEKAKEQNETAENEFVALELNEGLTNFAEECKIVQSLSNKNT